MITGSRSLLSIAAEPCWSPPSIHPTSARFPFRSTELLQSALLSSLGGCSGWFRRHTELLSQLWLRCSGSSPLSGRRCGEADTKNKPPPLK